MVIPRSRSSGALSIESNERNLMFGLCLLSTLVIAAVNVVLPWSMCPIVPTFTCGFDRSNFSFAMFLACGSALAGTGARGGFARDLRHDLLGDRARHLFVTGELHGVGRPPLGHRADVCRVAEHLAEGHVRANHLGAGAGIHRDDL